VIRPRYIVLGLGSLVAAGCASTPDRGTLAALRTVEPDVAEVEVADTLDLAMQSYRRYLNETPTSVMTPEAIRRLADLQLEKEFGITGGAPTQRWTEMAAPENAGTAPSEIGASTAAAPAATIADAVAAAESATAGPVDIRLVTEQAIGLGRADAFTELAGFEVLGAVRQYGNRNRSAARIASRPRWRRHCARR
jgi:hypothetical protein